MYQFKIYATGTCKYCVDLRRYIDENVNVFTSVEVYYVDQPEMKEYLDEIRSMGLTKVPQVWYKQDGVDSWIHIGGYEDFIAWHKLFTQMDAEQTDE